PLEQLRLAPGVDDGAFELASETALADLQAVGEGVVEPEVPPRGLHRGDEATAENGGANAQPPKRADEALRSRGEREIRRDSIEDLRGLPGEERHARPQALLEIELAAHGALGDLGHLLVLAAGARQLVDDLDGDEGGIHR